MKEEFEIRTMGFGELAQMYLPNIQPKSSSVRLRNWINASPDLRKSLESLGFKRRSRLLTPAMVALIVNRLGAP